jgi:hypothetical protein
MEKNFESHDTSNSDEMERIKDSGATIIRYTGTVALPFPLCCCCHQGETSKPRVSGLLVTRSFGDYRARLAELGGSPTGVTNEPYISVVNLQQPVRSGILICSDGVTDAVGKTATAAKENLVRQYIMSAQESASSHQFMKTTYTETAKMRTSNIGKYAIGQAVENLGADCVSGVISNLIPDVAGATSGPGKLEVTPTPPQVEDEISREICEIAVDPFFWKGGRSGADNTTALYVSVGDTK